MNTLLPNKTETCGTVCKRGRGTNPYATEERERSEKEKELIKNVSPEKKKATRVCKLFPLMIYVPKTADQAFDTNRPQISEPNHLQKKTCQNVSLVPTTDNANQSNFFPYWHREKIGKGTVQR
jgi:hypothetical protein